MNGLTGRCSLELVSRDSRKNQGNNRWATDGFGFVLFGCVAMLLGEAVAGGFRWRGKGGGNKGWSANSLSNSASVGIGVVCALVKSLAEPLLE